MGQPIWVSGKCHLHEQVSVTYDKKEALRILMHYEILLMYAFRIITNKFICLLSSFTN